MRFFKWLFQPAYLLLIIVIVALYINREAVFPQEVAESLEAETLVAKIEDITEGMREDIEEALESPEPTEEGVVETTVEEPVVEAAIEEPVVVEPAEPEIASTEITSAEVTPAQEVEEVVAGVAPTEPPQQVAAEEVVEAVPSVADTTHAEPVTTVEPAPESVPELAEVTEEVEQAASAQSSLAVWKQARGAVWQNDLDGAVSHYRELIAIQPDNYDAYGEMGNVLLAQAKAEQAAEAYATAARLIYRSGNREIAYRVADIVLKLDPRQAEGLRQEFAR